MHGSGFPRVSVSPLFWLSAVCSSWRLRLFLVGIAILATEFEWAERWRDRILVVIHYLGRQWRAHKIVGTLIVIACASCAVTLAYFSFQKLN
jgi:hypothetical protein